MPLKKLTTRFVDTVKTNEERLEIRDTDVVGLELRVTSLGVKTWALRYRRKSDGKRRLLTIGRFPDLSLKEARIRATEQRASIARGADPAQGVQDRREAPTFAEVAADWIREHGEPNKSPRALTDDRSMLNRHILPAVGGMKAAEVSKRDVLRLLSAVKCAPDLRFGPRSRRKDDASIKATANRTETRGRTLSHRPNRVFELIRAIFRWTLAQDILKFDPTQGMEPPIKKEKPRERDLSPEEIFSFWNNLNYAPMSSGIKIALKLALVTGQRIGEVTCASMAEFDLNDTSPVWTLPAARSKNGEANRVPLSSLAVFLVREAAELSGGAPWLFPSPNGVCPIKPHAATKAVERARPKLGLKNFRVHDLRRTAATRMAEMGISPHTISLVLNHVSARRGTITGKVYVQYAYDREKRDALTAWGARLEQLVAGTDGSNIVQSVRIGQVASNEVGPERVERARSASFG